MTLLGFLLGLYTAKHSAPSGHPIDGLLLLALSGLDATLVVGVVWLGRHYFS